MGVKQEKITGGETPSSGQSEKPGLYRAEISGWDTGYRESVTGTTPQELQQAVLERLETLNDGRLVVGRTETQEAGSWEPIT